MNTITPRKKQPALIRSLLLTAAAQLAVNNGFAALTLDAVAHCAGVSKGGLLHHFPNKQILIETMLKEMLDRLDGSIAVHLAQDSEPGGRFTRAYIRAVTDSVDDCFESRLRGISALTMCADASLAALWREWLQKHLAQCTDDDLSTLAHILRYAADGIWLDDISTLEKQHKPVRTAAIAHLIALTHTL